MTPILVGLLLLAGALQAAEQSLDSIPVIWVTVPQPTQAKPDFSGTWAWRPPASQTSAPPPLIMVITQDDQILMQGRHVFSLDGGGTVNEMVTSAGVVQLKSRARWVGSSLVLEMDGTTGTLTQVLSLSGDGSELTVDGVRDGRKASMIFNRR